MPYLMKWKVKGNPAKQKRFKLKKTVDAYEKHLRRFAGAKLQYLQIKELD